MSKQKIKNIAVVGSLLVLLVFAATMAYFSSTDAVTNRFIAGNVRLEIVEENYRSENNNRRLAYAQTMDKDPKIKNTGKNDEIVFLKVSVPLKSVTLIADNGAKVNSSAVLSEVFNIGCSEPMKSYGTGADEQTYYSDFQYHNDWVLLNSYPKKIGNEYVYIFGYSMVIKPDQSTSKLFETVTLKNILENTAVSVEHISVEGYGIQAQEVIEKYEDAAEVTLTADTLNNLYTTYFDQNGGNE